MLQAIDPKSVLGRGYAYVSNVRGEIIGSKASYTNQKNEDELQLHFKDGSVKIGKGK